MSSVCSLLILTKIHTAYSQCVIVIVIVIFKQGVHSGILIFSGALDKHTIKLICIQLIKIHTQKAYNKQKITNTKNQELR